MCQAYVFLTIHMVKGLMLERKRFLREVMSHSPVQNPFLKLILKINVPG